MPTNPRPPGLKLVLDEIKKRLAKKKENSTAFLNSPGNSIQRNDNLIQAITEQLDASRKLRESLEKGEKINTQDSGIKKTLRLAAYTLAMDMPKLTQKEIENKLLVDLPEKSDFQRETLENDFKEEMQLQPEGNTQDVLMTVDRDNPDNNFDLDATLLLDRGPENLPNIHNGVQSVRLYQEGNRVGVVLYTDKPNYSGVKNILEHFEEVADRRLAAAKKNAVEMGDEKPQGKQAKETAPKPTLETKRREEEEEEKQKKKKEAAGETKKEDIPAEKPKTPNPFNTALTRDRK